MPSRPPPVSSTSRRATRSCGSISMSATVPMSRAFSSTTSRPRRSRDGSSSSRPLLVRGSRSRVKVSAIGSPQCGRRSRNSARGRKRHANRGWHHRTDASRELSGQARLRAHPRTGAGRGWRWRRALRGAAPSGHRPALRHPAGGERRPGQLGGAARARPWIPTRSAWRCAPRTTRSSTSTSRARSRTASTAPATSSSGTGAPSSRRRPMIRRGAIRAGELKFRLFGERLRGRYTIVRTSGRGGSSRRARAVAAHQEARRGGGRRLGCRGPPDQRQDRPHQRRGQGRRAGRASSSRRPSLGRDAGPVAGPRGTLSPTSCRP